MPQVIYLPEAAESPLAQVISGLALGFREFQHQRERRRRQEEEDRRAAAQDLAQNLGIANLMRQNAADAPLAQAPQVETIEDMAGEAGVPPMSHDVASFAGLQLPPTPTPKRALMLSLPGGRTIPLAPLQYREEVRARHLADVAAEKEAGADVMDVPNDATMWGPLAGQRGIRTSTANTYLNALQRKDAAEANRIARQAMAEAAAAERAATRETAAGTRADNRADKSYQYNASQIERLSKPIFDQAERFSRLVETVEQRSPQADALIAPELLTVMAGGQGSGLRMNEAEIARLIGGRSNWEGLKAALNKWQLDPTKALSVTGAQRGQIRSLISAMRDRITKKVDAINEANQALIDAATPEEHRRIVAGLKEKFGTFGAAEAAPAADETRVGPDGRTWRKVRGGWQVVK